MERLLERDEFRARLALRVPVPPRELQARFDGFCAAVAEKGSRQARQRRQPLRHLPLQRMKEQIRNVNQRLRLVGDRARDARMRVPERRDADARQQVEVFPAFRVEQPDALSANKVDRIAAVRLENVFCLASLNVFEC